MFVAPATDVPEVEAGSVASADMDDARKVGMMLDVPLCRYSWCIMPGTQVAMSVWQPQYTLMFSALLGQPAPHYYFHVLLPGGAESLGEPGYELEPGSKASLVGTLMRVVYAKRNEDSTLTLIVQGLCRGVVLSPTQMLPYSRADVQLLPDGEALRAAARASKRFVASDGAVPGDGGDGGDGDDGAPASSMAASVKRRLVAAAAAREAVALFEYESTLGPSVDVGNALAGLNQFNSSAAATLAALPSLVTTALRDALPPEWQAVDSSGEGATPTNAFDGSPRVLADLSAAVAAAEAEGAAEKEGDATSAEADELRTLLALEVQVTHARAAPLRHQPLALIATARHRSRLFATARQPLASRMPPLAATSPSA